jgi:hypothetical protein
MTVDSPLCSFHSPGWRHFLPAPPKGVAPPSHPRRVRQEIRNFRLEAVEVDSAATARPIYLKAGLVSSSAVSRQHTAVKLPAPFKNKAARSGRLEVDRPTGRPGKRSSYIGPQAVTHWQSGGQ